MQPATAPGSGRSRPEARCGIARLARSGASENGLQLARAVPVLVAPQNAPDQRPLARRRQPARKQDFHIGEWLAIQSRRRRRPDVFAAGSAPAGCASARQHECSGVHAVSPSVETGNRRERPETIVVGHRSDACAYASRKLLRALLAQRRISTCLVVTLPARPDQAASRPIVSGLPGKVHSLLRGGFVQLHRALSLWSGSSFAAVSSPWPR